MERTSVYYTKMNKQKATPEIKTGQLSDRKFDVDVLNKIHQSVRFKNDVSLKLILFDYENNKEKILKK